MQHLQQRVEAAVRKDLTAGGKPGKERDACLLSAYKKVDGTKNFH
ncbi:hypothetical protein BRYFOR_06111 [Marvinbryantia formatexigens DSM 14469]|uniref:Uncharacterized protein n=1 Tax=Marvinbryantia formatexigens DSM 14469 TaxID=478749 RepID=C6LBW6_9FIRM|nr:hypothetical protein BRYFOR_06111 [Marvinbryantia formatexigens DSM 14469]